MQVCILYLAIATVPSWVHLISTQKLMDCQMADETKQLPNATELNSRRFFIIVIFSPQQHFVVVDGAIFENIPRSLLLFAHCNVWIWQLFALQFKSSREPVETRTSELLILANYCLHCSSLNWLGPDMDATTNNLPVHIGLRKKSTTLEIYSFYWVTASL